MGWLDVLLGRSKPPPAKPDALFALSTAQITLDVNLGLKSTGQAGICFRQVESSRFAGLAAELRDLLRLSAKEMGTEIETQTDSLGFQWVILTDPDLEDLVATIHMITQTLREQGFDNQLLAAVFSFREESGQIVYWLYNYKRGKFYPEVPIGPNQRDNSKELRLSAVLEKELPIEPELDRWYPMWGIPF